MKEQRSIRTDEKHFTLQNMRVAVCGSLPTVCRILREEGIQQIDTYTDALDLVYNIRSGTEYHLILVYAPQGEGLDAEHPYKVKPQGVWKNIPVRLLNEPACHSAQVELRTLLRILAAEPVPGEQERNRLAYAEATETFRI